LKTAIVDMPSIQILKIL